MLPPPCCRSAPISCPAATSAARSSKRMPATRPVVRTPAAGAPPVDFGHMIPGVAGEILGQLRGRRRLEAQIHFELDRLLERAHDLDRLQPAQCGSRPLDETRQPAQQVEIAGERARDPGPQHLDRNLRAFARRREMHLGDRRGGDRHIVEGLEQSRRSWQPNSPSISARASRAGNGGSLSCNSARSAAISSPSRSARVASICPSLMKAGPIASKRRGQALTRPVAAAAPPQQSRHPQHRARPDRLEQEQRVVARQGQADADQPRDVANAAK